MYQGVKQDDAYIFYTYAKNISNQNGYVFNLGERINATTSPLYTLLLAAVFIIFRWLPGITIPIIGHVIGAICLWLLCFFSGRLFSNDDFEVLPFAFPLLFLANPLLKHAVGMEIFLTLMLIMLSFYLYQIERYKWLATVSALAILSRPDSVLMLVVLLMDYLLQKRNLPSWHIFAIFASVVAPWYIFSYLYFGGLLPSTLAAKMAQAESICWGQGWTFFKEISGNIWPYGNLTKLPMVIIICISLCYLLYRSKEWLQKRIVILILLWFLLYLFFYSFVLNPPAYYWYYTPLAIGISLVIGLFFERLFMERIFYQIRLRETFVYILAFGICLGALVVPKISYFQESSRYETYLLVSRWLNENAFEGASVAANEIGVIGYFYQRGRIIDALGLVTPGVADHVRKNEFNWYINEYEPDFLMFQYPHRPILEKMVEEPWFETQYQREKIFKTEWMAAALYKKRKRATHADLSPVRRLTEQFPSKQ